jgi:hypothetical protein
VWSSEKRGCRRKPSAEGMVVFPRSYLFSFFSFSFLPFNPLKLMV